MTNTTKLSAAALFSALVLGAAFAGSSTVSAQGTGVDFGESTHKAATETGHAYVGFTKTTPNGVEDPDDPDNPDITTPVNNDPTGDHDITGEVGVLTLDAIPSSLNFGTQEAIGAGQIVDLLAHGDAKADADPAKPDEGRANATGNQTSDYTRSDGQTIFTQVTNAAAFKPTWTLAANMTEFTSNEGGTLPGAYITFGGGKNVVDTAADSGDRSWKDAEGTFTTDAQLKAGGSTQIAESSQTGTFQQQWLVKDVKLTTPQAPAEGQYKATIDWVLSATPETYTAPTITVKDPNPEGTNPAGE